MSLNKRQKLFCQYFIQYGDPKFACLKAGYKNSNPYRLLQNPKINQFLHQNHYNIYKNEDSFNIASSMEIKQYLTKVMRGQEQQAPSIKEKIKAAELLGKSFSIFSGKQQHITNNNPVIFYGEEKLE